MAASPDKVLSDVSLVYSNPRLIIVLAVYRHQFSYRTSQLVFKRHWFQEAQLVKKPFVCWIKIHQNHVARQFILGLLQSLQNIRKDFFFERIEEVYDERTWWKRVARRVFEDGLHVVAFLSATSIALNINYR